MCWRILQLIFFPFILEKIHSIKGKEKQKQQQQNPQIVIDNGASNLKKSLGPLQSQTNY